MADNFMTNPYNLPQHVKDEFRALPAGVRPDPTELAKTGARLLQRALGNSALTREIVDAADNLEYRDNEPRALMNARPLPRIQSELDKGTKFAVKEFDLGSNLSRPTLEVTASPKMIGLIGKWDLGR